MSARDYAERRWPYFATDPDHARAVSTFVQGAGWVLDDLAQRQEEAMPAQARASSWMTFNQFIDLLHAESITALASLRPDDA